MKEVVILPLLLFACLLTSCITGQNGTSTNTCTRLGKVVDMKGLDGCEFLIELVDGKRLLPIFTSEPEVELEDGMRVRLGFTVKTDHSSICMAEDLVGEITCLEVIID